MSKLLAMVSVAFVFVLGGYAAASAADRATGSAGKQPSTMSAVAAQVQPAAASHNQVTISRGGAGRTAAAYPLERSKASRGVQSLHGLASSPTCRTSSAPPGAVSSNCAAP